MRSAVALYCATVLLNRLLQRHRSGVAQQSTPQRHATPEPAMSMAELEAWAARTGMALVDRKTFEADCAEFARLTVKQTDLDLEYQILLRDV